MKNMKRFTALLLAMVMVLSLGSFALAAGPIDTGVDPNIRDFTGKPGPITDLTVRFETDENLGTLEGSKVITVAPGSKIPEKFIPTAVPKPGYQFIGWIVEHQESQGLVDLDKYAVSRSIVMIAQYVKSDATLAGNLLNKADHNFYMQGHEDKFRPDDNLKRAEAAQVFYNLLLDKNVPITKTFSDVKADAWYGPAVLTLASLGIIDGYDDGTFKPMKSISRAEFAAIASRFDSLEEGTVSFPDVPKTHWAHKYVSSATAKGWVDGYPDGTFRPGKNITRAAVAKITNGVLGRKPDQAFIDSNPVVAFTDLRQSHWAYYQIMEATNSHDYTSSGTVETWNALK